MCRGSNRGRRQVRKKQVAQPTSCFCAQVLKASTDVGGAVGSFASCRLSLARVHSLYLLDSDNGGLAQKCTGSIMCISAECCGDRE